MKKITTYIEAQRITSYFRPDRAKSAPSPAPPPRSFPHADLPVARSRAGRRPARPPHPAPASHPAYGQTRPAAAKA